jgi:hypothetical protein
MYCKWMIEIHHIHPEYPIISRKTKGSSPELAKCCSCDDLKSQKLPTFTFPSILHSDSTHNLPGGSEGTFSPQTCSGVLKFPSNRILWILDANFWVLDHPIFYKKIIENPLQNDWQTQKTAVKPLAKQMWSSKTAANWLTLNTNMDLPPKKQKKHKKKLYFPTSVDFRISELHNSWYPS